MRNPILLALLLLCMQAGISRDAAALAPIPPPGVDLVHIVSLPVLGADLVGLPVQDTEGRRAGRIVDLVLDLQNNRVRHAIVGTPGERLAVSLFHLHLSLTRAHVVLPADDSLIRRAEAAEGPTLRELLGAAVVDAAGTPAGRFAGIVVDVHEGEVPFALLGAGDALHPLPLDALRRTAQGLALTLELDVLQPAHAFSAATLHEELENDRFLLRHARYADRLTPHGAGTRSASR